MLFLFVANPELTRSLEFGEIPQTCKQAGPVCKLGKKSEWKIFIVI